MAHRTERELQRMPTRYRTLTGEDAAGGRAAPRAKRGAALDGGHARAGRRPDGGLSSTRWAATASSSPPIYAPGAIEEFVDQVVPELQRRGRYRRGVLGRHAARPLDAGGLRAPRPPGPAGSGPRSPRSPLRQRGSAPAAASIRPRAHAELYAERVVEVRDVAEAASSATSSTRASRRQARGGFAQARPADVLVRGEAGQPRNVRRKW